MGSPRYLAQWLQPCLHDELVLAQLTAACIRALDPLLQTGLVHEVQAARAVAWCDQRALVIALAVADPGGRENCHSRNDVLRRGHTQRPGPEEHSEIAQE